MAEGDERLAVGDGLAPACNSPQEGLDLVWIEAFRHGVQAEAI